MTSTSPPPSQPSATHLTALTPIVTDGAVKRPSYQRSTSSGKERLSTHSNISFTSQNRSRPGSHVFPVFHSSLPYALVRDFAYPDTHPLHYGPLPFRASDVSTPVSEQRRLSDPPAPWDSSRGQWSTGPWSTENSYGHQQLPAMSFGDGPPYSEDEDLHSPVFSAPRHRKNKSTGTDLNLNGRKGKSGRGWQPPEYYTNEPDRGTLVSMNADGSETYYFNDEDAADDGPGGEFVTYSANESRYSHIPSDSYDGHHDEQDLDFESEDEFTGNRYSRDFQFAVGCPDEEMNGKAVALFDFTREHENELPLTEGQVIFVSYRHGQGWLVAEDPKTGESGLVPEEFVRLLRDIEGGLTSLNGDTETEYHLESTEQQDKSQPLSSEHSTPVNGEKDNKAPAGDESNSNTSHLDKGNETTPHESQPEKEVENGSST